MAGVFVFDATLPVAVPIFLLRDGGKGGGNDFPPNEIRFLDLLPGTHTVTAREVEGWELTQLVCEDPDQGSTTDLGSATAIIDVVQINCQRRRINS